MTVGAMADGVVRDEPALAYVFWHPPASGEVVADYEAALSTFHRALADTPIAGLLATRAARVPDVPWLPGGGYEDWYIVRNYGDLGELNGAAVDTARRHAHADIASRSGRGSGALYGLNVGTAAIAPAVVVWLSKPRNVPYSEFYGELLARIGSAERLLKSAVGVWRRQLVLGPAPEFCVTAPEPLPELPPAWSPFSVPVRSVYGRPDQ